MSLELLGLACFFGFALGLFTWGLLSALLTVQQEFGAGETQFSNGPLFRLALPFVRYLGRMVAPLDFLTGAREGIRWKLIRSGRGETITPDEFIGLMLVCMVPGALVWAYFELIYGIGLMWGLAIVFLCGLLPLFSLNDAVKRRQHAVRRQLPYTLDLLTLSVEAGLDFSQALVRIADHMPASPLRDELRQLARDLTMGKTRPEALRDMEARIGIEELTTVVSALVQADELGSSLGPTLRIQSQELQRKRFQRAEKKAMQAPVLMLIPLVLFIFPVVFLTIFAPMGLRVWSQFAE